MDLAEVFYINNKYSSVMPAFAHTGKLNKPSDLQIQQYKMKYPSNVF